MSHEHDEDAPIYVIGVAARLVEMHPQSLRYYERIGLVIPKRSAGRLRMYSRRDVDRLLQIQRLVRDLGVNLAGVEVIMRLLEQMQTREQQLQTLQRDLEAEVAHLRALVERLET